MFVSTTDSTGQSEVLRAQRFNRCYPPVPPLLVQAARQRQGWTLFFLRKLLFNLNKAIKYLIQVL